MDIKGLNTYNHFYSPQSIQQNKPVQTEAEISNTSVGSNQRNEVINRTKEIAPVSTLNVDEKTYFSEQFNTNPQVQTYLGSGELNGFLQKGQVVDFKG